MNVYRQDDTPSRVGGAAGDEGPQSCHHRVVDPPLGVTEKNKTLIMYRNLSCKNNKMLLVPGYLNVEKSRSR